MVRPIMKDIFFLNQPSQAATKADTQVAQDLIDTLAAHRQECVGMAANMIGVRKRIIIADTGFLPIIMYNPIIVTKKNPYETEEGCLSLTGVRPTTRYEEIEVTYEDIHFKKCKQKFTGFVAQIIQHEVDHLDGRII